MHELSDFSLIMLIFHPNLTKASCLVHAYFLPNSNLVHAYKRDAYNKNMTIYKQHAQFGGERMKTFLHIIPNTLKRLFVELLRGGLKRGGLIKGFTISYICRKH